MLRVAARRLIEVDPYNETGHRALMRLFAEEGEPARAREIYLSLAAAPARRISASEPDRDDEALYESLLPARPRHALAQSIRLRAQRAAPAARHGRACGGKVRPGVCG